MNLSEIILCRRSQISKRTCFIFQLYDIQKRAKFICINRKQLIIAWVGVGVGERIGKRPKGTFWGNGKVLCLYWGVDYMGIYIFFNSSDYTLKICRYNAFLKRSCYDSGKLKDQSRGAAIIEVVLNKVTSKYGRQKNSWSWQWLSFPYQCHSSVTHFGP